MTETGDALFRQGATIAPQVLTIAQTTTPTTQREILTHYRK